MSYDGKRRCFYFTEKDLKVSAVEGGRRVTWKFKFFVDFLNNKFLYELLIVVFKREEAAARTWGEDKDEEGEEGRDGTGANSSG